MGKYLNIILTVVIIITVIIITAVCSNFFYKKGQDNAWALSQKLMPLHKGGIYLCVEETGANGVSYLTVKELNEAIKDNSLSQKDLKFRVKLALNGLSLKEYEEKFGGRR